MTYIYMNNSITFTKDMVNRVFDFPSDILDRHHLELADNFMDNWTYCASMLPYPGHHFFSFFSKSMFMILQKYVDHAKKICSRFISNKWTKHKIVFLFIYSFGTILALSCSKLLNTSSLLIYSLSLCCFVQFMVVKTATVEDVHCLA